MARTPGKGRLGSHLNQRVSKAAGKLDDHKLALGLVVAALGAFLAYIAFVSTTGPPFQSKYEVQVQVPADAPPLRKGQAVRIGGKLAGLISSVEPDRENDGSIVTANITKTQFRPLGEDAQANVRVHSIVYNTYLELYPGDAEGDPMDSGGVIEQAQVSSGVDLLEVVQLFDKAARESLRSTVVNLGYGLAGRGPGLNAAFQDLEPTSVNLARQLEAATSEPGAIGASIAGAAATTEGLRGKRSDDVAGLVGSGSEVLGTIAGRETELAEAIRLLRPFEDEFLATAPIAEPLLDDLAATAVDLEPAVRELNAALPEVTHLLSLGDELVSESSRIAAAVNPVLAATRPVVYHMFPLVSSLDPLIADTETVVDNVGPYADDIALSGQSLAAATSIPFPQGQGVGAGAPMGRLVPVLTCHRPRNPFPAPGTAPEDSQSC